MKYLAITAILCLILAGASFAGNVTMTEVITGADLTLTMPGYFTLSYVTLGGASSQNSSSNQYYYVEDARGTGVGWNLGFSIDQFKTSGTPTRTIATDKFAMKGGTASKVWGQDVDFGANPQPLYPSDFYNVQNSEVKFLTTAANWGMGKYMISFSHQLTIPASAYAGTYTATLTTTLNNIP